MNIWRSLGGNVAVELTSAVPEETIAAINGSNIELWNLQKHTELICSFSMARSSYEAVKRICKRRGDTLRVLKRSGLYWHIKESLSRPVLLLGSLLFLILIVWLPTRVLFVQVDGNSRVPSQKILEAAETCGIRFGASRREVRSERVKNALLAAVPELQWAGVNTAGCTATVSVREKEDAQILDDPGDPASILASRDGYVLSCTATAGNLLIRPGDSVRQGQVMISAYTDCGLCIRAERASGEVVAQTSRQLEALMPADTVKKGKQKSVKRKLSLIIRKKRIFLWKDSGIWEGTCGRMYEEYYITLPGGFQLPFAFCVESYEVCERNRMELSQEEADYALKAFAHSYLNRQMVAGKLLNGVQTVEREKTRYRLKGVYTCTEMIGIVRREQIGDTNGKNS